MAGGMGERGQAVVTSGGSFLLVSLFFQPLRWTHPELGGPSPWKAVGGGGPWPPAMCPTPSAGPTTLHVHPSPPDPFTAQGTVTREALMTSQQKGPFLGVPRGSPGVSALGWGADLGLSQLRGICEGRHLGWGLGGESRSLPGLKRVLRRLWERRQVTHRWPAWERAHGLMGRQ